MFPALALFLFIFISFSPASPAEETTQQKPAKSIGVATMEKDGTIRMRLRSTGPGPSGEGSLVYTKTNPEYNNIVKHLGGLKPGELKSVPPFPQETKKQ